MSAIHKSEKPARNLAIRKFSELTTIRNLDDALAHLAEQELNEAVLTLHKNNPQDQLISRKAKTLEMTRLLEEIKCHLTPAEKNSLLGALRLESLDLENQIVMTKKAIDKRAQFNKLINSILEKIQKENQFDKAVLLANTELFEAIDHLSQANPQVYEEKQKFLLLVKEIASLKDRVMEKDKAALLNAIQSSDLEKLKQALSQAKDSIRLYNLLSQYIDKYADDNYFTKAFEKEQTERSVNAKGFFKPKIKNPTKLAQITLLEYLAAKIAKDESLTPEHKGEALYTLLIMIKDHSENNKLPYLVNTLEKTMKELEYTTYILPANLATALQTNRLALIYSRLNDYLEEKKLTAAERRLIQDLTEYNQAPSQIETQHGNSL